MTSQGMPSNERKAADKCAFLAQREKTNRLSNQSFACMSGLQILHISAQQKILIGAQIEPSYQGHADGKASGE
jgi:hypothetical protein